MKELRYETPIEQLEYKNLVGPTIFLAGPTVRGHQQHLQPSWRFEACRLLKEKGFDGNIIIPEFADVTNMDKGQEDWIVPWEYKGLSNADCILFWIPRTRELIGLTTNFEIGFFMNSCFSHIVYGRPDDAYRMKYIDIMYNLVLLRKPFNTLSDTCEEAIEKSIFYFNQFKDIKNE